MFVLKSGAELHSLDPLLKSKLCKLLNVEQEGADWGALADRLQLTSSKTHLQSFKDPTEQLIEEYVVSELFKNSRYVLPSSDPVA